MKRVGDTNAPETTAGSLDLRRLATRSWLRSHAALVFVILAALAPLPALAAGGEARPYDDKLLRLSEILGAVHFLRELCGADDGQLWRQQMAALMDAEGSSAARRVRFVNSFNGGYRSYRRTYQTCTTAAQEQIGRFLTEGAELAKSLAETKP